MDVCVGNIACTWESQFGVRGSVGVCCLGVVCVCVRSLSSVELCDGWVVGFAPLWTYLHLPQALVDALEDHPHLPLALCVAEAEGCHALLRGDGVLLLL